MIFDFRLRVFRTVANKLSYTKAANELFITQPAVTKHINELEQQLEVRLFNRSGGTITLTVAGQLLLSHAEKVFKIYAQFENDLALLKGINGGSIHVGASTTIAQYVIPRILALFKKAHPSVEVHLVTGNTEYIEQLLIAEKIDIGLVEGVSHLQQIHYEPFVKDEIVLVARGQNKLFSKKEIKPEQLTNMPVVLREKGSGTLEVIYDSLGKVDIFPKDLKIDVHLDSTEGIKQYLMFSDSVAFLSIHSITKELQNNQLSILDIKGVDIYRTFQFIKLHGNTHKTIELFRRFCLSHYS